MSRHILLVAVVALFALTSLAVAPAAVAAPPGPTIVDVALQVNKDTDEFDTLIAALQAADPAVISTLSGNGQFTVFAPTDAAFAALGYDETTIGSLPQDALTNILLYHAARGRRDATDVTSSTQIRMLNGQFTQISLNGGAFINDAPIVGTDVFAANGVIHVIDSVLMP